jgi:hypothetical protein
MRLLVQTPVAPKKKKKEKRKEKVCPGQFSFINIFTFFFPMWRKR